MQNDVVQKIIDSNDVLQGAAVVSVDKVGNKQRYLIGNEDSFNVQAVASGYAQKFDDRFYYVDNPDT